MISGELDEFRYAFKQRGLNKDGTTDEVQYITFRALDGIGGRFYQIVLADGEEEKFWSFSEPEDLIPMIKKFIEWSNKIDDM